MKSEESLNKKIETSAFKTIKMSSNIFKNFILIVGFYNYL